MLATHMKGSAPDEGRFDLVVLGGGPAGEKGAAQAAYHGHSVAVVERRTRPLEAASVVVGGVPVKALRDTAIYLSGWARRETYGIAIRLSPELAMDRLRSRTLDVMSSMATMRRENLLRHQVTVIPGEGRLGPDRTVIVRDDDGRERTLRAGVILIATGSHPLHPPGVPFEDPDVHDSETVLAMDRLPSEMMVVGGGPVGSEYASIFAALGVHVTLVDRGQRLLPMLDAEVSAGLTGILSSTGVKFMFGAQVDSVARDRRGLRVVVNGVPVRPDVVVHAVGRVGNVEGLGLAEMGVESDARGRIVVDSDFQTTASGIFAAGDIVGPPGLASVGMEQARVAMCRAFHIHFKDAVDPVVPAGIYTLPEVSMIGLTEEAAVASGEEVVTGRALFEDNARARIAGSSEGLVKLVFRASDRRLLGAHILGEEATELIHVAQAVLHAGGMIDEFIDTTFNFPSRADAYKYAAYDGLRGLDLLRESRPAP
jgi:NAD(P) transhydrogenase